MSFIEGVRLGYLAAIIDGEGSIDIRRKNRPWGYGYSPHLSVANKSYELLDSVKDMVGKGTIQDLNPSGTRLNVSYEFRLLRIESVLELLRALSPYFMSGIKKQLCELVIEFCESRRSGFSDCIRVRGGYQPYSLREIEIWREVKLLHKKGGKGKGVPV